MTKELIPVSGLVGGLDLTTKWLDFIFQDDGADRQHVEVPEEPDLSNPNPNGQRDRLASEPMAMVAQSSLSTTP